jgi:DNA-binding NarL/FixJ family response regulator
MNSECEKIRVIVIEDDRQITDTVTQHLSSQQDMEVLSCYGSIEDFKKGAHMLKKSPDVVLLDIVLPNMSGIEGIHLIKQQWPSTNVIIFSVMDDGFNLFRSLCEGAVGYLTKDVPLPGVLTAIRDVYEGKGIMSPSIARKVAEYFHPKKSMHEVLTSREIDIVNGIIEGLSYKLVADKLNISIDTVRKHIKNIYKKLHINSKSQLLQQYFN